MSEKRVTADGGWQRRGALLRARLAPPASVGLCATRCGGCAAVQNRRAIL